MKSFLPIGSVVLLNAGKKKLMIVGVKQKDVSTSLLWDYSACLYPEGIIDPQKLYLFNHEQIERVYFIGFQDLEGLEFIDKISTL